MSKKKRTLSPEHLAKLQAGRAKALARENPTVFKSTPGILPTLESEEEVTLDLTKENLVNETDLLERIRRMFDEGNNPTQIKVTSRQMMDILDNSSRMVSYYTYSSPFGDHEVKVIPARDL